MHMHMRGAARRLALTLRCNGMLIIDQRYRAQLPRGQAARPACMHVSMRLLKEGSTGAQLSSILVSCATAILYYRQGMRTQYSKSMQRACECTPP